MTDFINAALPYIAIGLFLAIYFARKGDKHSEKNCGDIGMSIGMALGVAIGASSQNMLGVWMAVGMFAGLFVGSIIKPETSESENGEINEQ